MQHVIQALLNMNHPHATIQYIFTFLWCIWKLRNDALFARKNGLPHQVYHVATAIAECQALRDGQKNNKQQIDPNLPTQPADTVLLQGNSIKSDLIAGPRIYSDVAFNS